MIYGLIGFLIGIVCGACMVIRELRRSNLSFAGLRRARLERERAQRVGMSWSGLEPRPGVVTGPLPESATRARRR